MDEGQDEPDVVTVLREQHGEIRELLSAVREASDDERGSLFETLVRLLAVHETSEEEVVYPIVSLIGDDARAEVDARKLEESEAKKRLAGLEAMGPGADGFAEEFDRFADDVEHHASAEEASIFPLLARYPDRQQLERMAILVQAAQATAPTHAHRLAPEGALANLAVGPFVAVVDRVRDAIRDARQ